MKATGYLSPHISPDGKRITLSVSGERHYDVWTYDLAQDVWNRLTFDGGHEPTWSPDG